MKKKTQARRQTLAEKLQAAREEGIKRGHDVGWSDGQMMQRRELLPPDEARAGILDFIRGIEAWPIAGDAVVMIAATDMKHVCNIVIPARVMQVIASVMKKRLA